MLCDSSDGVSPEILGKIHLNGNVAHYYTNALHPGLGYVVMENVSLNVYFMFYHIVVADLQPS